MQTHSLDAAIRDFDLDRILAECRSNTALADSALATTGYLRLINAAIQAPASELLRGLKALDEAFGGPDPNDKGVLLMLLSLDDADCLAWAQGHGLVMQRLHLTNYIDHLLTRVHCVDLHKESQWRCDMEATDDFKRILLSASFLRGDNFEQLTCLHEHLGGEAIAGAELGKQVAKLIYRDQAQETPNGNTLHPSNGGCAWFLQHARTKDLSEGAEKVLIGDKNQVTLIKPLVKHLPLGAIEHQAHLIDAGTVPARSLSGKRRL